MSRTALSLGVSGAADAGMLVQWFGGMMLVLLVVWLCLLGLRRLNQLGMPVKGQIRLLGGIPLGGREKLLVVEVGKVQLVLGVAPGRIEALHVLEGDARLEPENVQPFARRLQHVFSEKKL